ncbi:MAG: DUF1045 domain-containing protein, partial [Pseudomonadota bacterium]
VGNPDLGPLPAPVAEITARPRKYGFHATIKPPFFLAEGETETSLAAAFDAFAASAKPVSAPALAVRRLGKFIALVEAEPAPGLNELAASAVRDLDRFRAPPTEADLARRRASNLSERQDALLLQWGYPYVMEEFRFHMTLTGPLDDQIGSETAKRLSDHVATLVPRPYPLDTLTLCGESEDGRFHAIHRRPLGG